MNFWIRPFFLPLAAVLTAFVPSGWGQQPPPASDPVAPSAVAAPAAPQPPAAPASPAVEPPPATPGEITPVAPAAPVEEPGALRRIDEVPETQVPPTERAPVRRVRNRNDGIPFGDHRVQQDRRAREAISLLGATTVEGEVESDAVSILGRTVIASGAKVGGAAVAVLGRLESEGDIGREAVSVMGASSINGRVGGEAVSVLGNLHLGPKAVIEGDVVVVGGRLTKADGAVVHGNEVKMPFTLGVGDMEWLADWVKRCAMLGRPLAFGGQLGWAWLLAFSFLAFYLLLALLFARGMRACVQTLETRPGYSILASVLTVLLSPVVIVLLAITVVGALLVPFVGAGLVFASLFGKAVMLAFIGRIFTRFFGDGPLGHPVFAVLIGGLIVLGLYTVPIIGFLTFKLLSWLGLGVVVYTVILSMKRERPPAAPASPVAPMPVPPVVPPPTAAPAMVAPMTPSSAVPLGAVPMPAGSAGFTGASAPLPDVPVIPPVASPPQPPSPPPPPSAEFPRVEASATSPESPPAAAMPPVGFSGRPMVAPVPMGTEWPRAGFVIRLCAMALDGILVGLILSFFFGMLPRALQFHGGPGPVLIVLAAYGAVMWKHKGTTVGGIVCGLKVVRLDQREVDWSTAIVRALGCFLSLAVAGLGFIWVAIDDEKQSWHDKIAGTTVVRVPKGVSLV